MNLRTEYLRLFNEGCMKKLLTPSLFRHAIVYFAKKHHQRNSPFPTSCDQLLLVSIRQKSQLRKQDRFTTCFNDLWNRLIILEGGQRVQSPFGAKSLKTDKYTGLVDTDRQTAEKLETNKKPHSICAKLNIWATIKEENTVCKCECEIRRNFVLDLRKLQFEHLK